MRKNHGIQKKIVLSGAIITIIPLLILEIVFCIQIQRSTQKKFYEMAEIYADQLEENYSNELEKLEHLAQTLANFSTLEQYFSMEFPDKASAFHWYLDNVHPMLSSSNHIYEGVRVRIYHDSGQFSNFSFELNDGLPELLEDTQLQLSQLQSDGVWLHSNLRYNTYCASMSYFLPVRSKKWPNDISYVVSVHLDESSFYTQIINEPVQNAMVLVLDRDGNILSSNNRTVVGQNARDIQTNGGLPLSSVQTEQRITLFGNEYLSVCREPEFLRVIYLMSVEDMTHELGSSIRILVLTGFVLLIVSVLMLDRNSKRLTRGIQELTEKMRQVDRASIRSMAATKVDMDGGDEVTQLNAVFSDMMAQIDLLIDTVSMKEQKIKDALIARQHAEILALQHQIDPHYLFNTLEAIRMNLILKDDRQDAEIVRIFSESFRHYMDMREEYVPLREEVEFIRKYIYIQNYRVQDKIVFQTQIDESVLNCRIFKLLLQPLVENAVVHGLEPRGWNGRIVLSVQLRENVLEISVEDDGVGMEHDQLMLLREQIETNHPVRQSIAMNNVYRRIRLAYGEQAQMTINSKPGVGTTVTLTLPMSEEHVCTVL